MRVSFIGMSNIGKSHWAKLVAADMGCEHIDCDELIEKKLGAELAQGGFHGLDGIAKWMGFPADPQYERNSRRYLDCEREVMREALDRLQQNPKHAAVIDTTGSVIYTGADILASLHATTRIIYFEASDAHIDELFKSYIAHPKPVIWGDKYQPKPNETAEQTLQRCYPELLRERARRYKELAHMTIPLEQHKAHDADFKSFLPVETV